EAPAVFPAPSADDVLARLPPDPALQAPSADRQAPPEPEPEIGWQDRGRRVLRRSTPGFPEQLVREGLEAEVAARFTVSPSGAVTEVEIVGSSGYTLVDRSVVQALREYTFEAAGGSDRGTIRFRFRL